MSTGEFVFRVPHTSLMGISRFDCETAGVEAYVAASSKIEIDLHVTIVNDAKGRAAIEAIAAQMEKLSVGH